MEITIKIDIVKCNDIEKMHERVLRGINQGLEGEWVWTDGEDYTWTLIKEN